MCICRWAKDTRQCADPGQQCLDVLAIQFAPQGREDRPTGGLKRIHDLSGKPRHGWDELKSVVALHPGRPTRAHEQAQPLSPLRDQHAKGCHMLVGIVYGLAQDGPRMRTQQAFPAGLHIDTPGQEVKQN